MKENDIGVKKLIVFTDGYWDSWGDESTRYIICN